MGGNFVFWGRGLEKRQKPVFSFLRGHRSNLFVAEEQDSKETCLSSVVTWMTTESHGDRKQAAQLSLILSRSLGKIISVNSSCVSHCSMCLCWGKNPPQIHWKMWRPSQPPHHGPLLCIIFVTLSVVSFIPIPICREPLLKLPGP